MRLFSVLALAISFVPIQVGASTDETLQVFDQETYETKVQPAFNMFIHGRLDGPLRALLRETIVRLDTRPLPPRYAFEREKPRDAVARMLRMLEGDTSFDAQHLVKRASRKESLEHMVKSELVPLLLDCWCVQWVDGVPAELVLWDSPLAQYLYQRSPWIKGEFYGTSPPTYASMDPSRCEATGWVAPWWVTRFEVELKRVSRPSKGQAARDYDLLLKMLEMVRTRPALRLVIELC